MVTSRDTDCFSFARSLTFSNLYLVSDFSSSLWYDKAIRKKQTALKHLETFQRLKPISDKSKRGMGFMRKQYAEKHQQELNEFAKAVRYMNANGIKAADYGRIAGELQQLLDEQAQLRAALAEQNVDPDLIDRIRYCVDTVIKAGEEPRQSESIRVQLKIHQSKRKPDAKDDIFTERKDASQLV